MVQGHGHFYPDKANEQDALFRLAVAYWGAQDDNPNAIVFSRVRKFPDHAEVPAAYLSLETSPSVRSSRTSNRASLRFPRPARARLGP